MTNEDENYEGINISDHSPEFQQAARAIYSKTFTQDDAAEIKKSYQLSDQRFTINENGEYIWPRLSWLRKRCMNLPTTSSVVDLGSCTGTFGNAIYNLGFNDVTCVELSVSAVEHGQSLFPQLTWINADIETWTPEKNYDILILFEVLEHLPHHRDTLKKYLSHVNPGGHILITVPTKECIIRDFEAGHYDHLNYFEENELADLGTVIPITSSDEVYTWHAVDITK